MARLPFNGSPRMTCNNACHKRRTPPSGGEDWGMAVGTRLYAPFTGLMRYRTAGSGGWTVTITADDPRLQGLTVNLMHLSGAPGMRLGQSRRVVEGELVAYSGGAKGHPGAGNSTGPHLHGHATRGGVRIAVTEAIAWASAQLIPPVQTEQDFDMPRIYHQVNTDGNQAYIVEGNFGFDIVSTDHAKAICKAWQIDFGTLVKINEFDFNALAEAKRKDVSRIASIVAASTASGGNGASAADIAKAVDKVLSDDFAAIRADVNKPRTLQ